MLKLLVTVLAVVGLVTSQSDDDSMEVSLGQGVVKGYKSADEDYYKFLGIPYATAPTGVDRFKAPQDAPTWNGTLEAVTTGISCPQFSNSVYLGTDECLIANVFVPASSSNRTDVPVLVFTHGGIFYLGSGPTNVGRIISQEIIIVTFNYRLGVHGFLCLRTEDAPGNAGLKDQVAALRWIKENIANFGGDPENITLYGLSAGSVSVDLLMLSKTTNGLFHRIITESGSAINGWAVNYDPLQVAKTAAEFLGFPDVEDTDVLGNIFMNATSEQLSIVAYQISINTTDTTTGFAPCLERKLDNYTVLTKSPMNIILSGEYNPVPILTTYANMEGIFLLGLLDIEDYVTNINANFSNYLPPDLTFASLEERENVAETIKSHYFGDLEVGQETTQEFVNFLTDVMFFYGTRRSALLHSENSVPVYLMEYNYYTNTSVLPGANHGDMARYILSNQIFLEGSNDDLLAERLSNIWANFVKYGNPSPANNELQTAAWPEYTAGDGYYLSVGEEVALLQRPLEDHYNFWDAIYAEYYNELLSPSSNSSYSLSYTYSVSHLLMALIYCIHNM